MPGGPMSSSEIQQATKATVNALASCGLSCCLVGGAACALYGLRNRTPSDVDMVVLTSMHSETVKQIIVSEDDMFFLVPSVNPQNTYKILWYSLSYRKTSTWSRPRACKVDILTPGTLSIPGIPKEYITSHTSTSLFSYGKDLPAAPFMVVLLLKLRAWKDHGNASELRYAKKKPVDERDIMELLEIARRDGIKLGNSKGWVSKALLTESGGWLQQFMREIPRSKELWRHVLNSSRG